MLGVLSAVLVVTPFAIPTEPGPAPSGVLDAMAITGVSAGIVALLLAAAAAWRGPRRLAAIGAAAGSVWMLVLTYLVFTAD